MERGAAVAILAASLARLVRFPLVCADLRGSRITQLLSWWREGVPTVDEIFTGGIQRIPGSKHFTRLTLSGLRIAWNWTRAHKVSIYGQPRSGKTSFIRYIRTGAAADPDEATTIDHKKYGMTAVRST